MQLYRKRPGVVLLEIEGVYLLVSDSEARKHCHYIQEINEVAAFIWKQLDQVTSFDELLNIFMTEYDMENICDLKKDLNQFFRLLKEASYLM